MGECRAPAVAMGRRQPAQAVVTKYHRVPPARSPDHKRAFSHSSGGLKPEIKVSAGSASGGTSPLGVRMPVSDCTLTWLFLSAHTETARALTSLPLIRTLILWDQGPTLMASLNLNCILKGLVSKYSQGFSIRSGGRGHTSVHNRGTGAVTGKSLGTGMNLSLSCRHLHTALHCFLGLTPRSGVTGSKGDSFELLAAGRRA